jgi:hypothetical protein
MKRAATTAAVLALSAFLASASGLEEQALAPVDGFGVELVEIRSGTMDVSVSPGEAAQAVVSGEPESDFPWEDSSPGMLRQERDGTRLYAWIESDGPFSAPMHGQIRVRVPRGASLRVRTSSGSVTVEGLEGGKVDVRTTSGSVTLRRVHARVLVDSVSGSVDIDSADGPLDARTVSGRIEGRRLLLSDYCELSSVSGSIDIGVLSGLENIGFDLRSVSGSIRVGTIRTEHGLRMGFGRTLVRARTISGSVSFQ